MARCSLTLLGVFTFAFFLPSRAEAGVIFRINGEVTSTKELTVYGYAGNGVITDSNFFATDYFIGTRTIGPPGGPPPPAGSPITVDFDVTDFFQSLPPGTQWA